MTRTQNAWPLADARLRFLSSFPTHRHEVTILSLCLVIAVWRLWLAQMGSSLWLDETGTVWAVKGTLAQALDRSWMHPGQPSVLYSIIAWLLLLPGFPMEWTLRLPSIMAMAGAGIVLYRLAVRFGLRGEAMLAVTVFATSGPVIFAAADARPYAIALLSVVAAVLMLTRWLDSGRSLDAAAYVVLTAISIHLHYTCALMCLVHAAYAVYRLNTGSRVSPSGVVLAVALPPALCLPLAPHAANLWALRAPHSFVGTPGPAEFARAVLPSTLLICLAAGLSAGRWIAKGLAWRPPQEPPRSSFLLLTWYLLPMTLCFAVSRLSEAKVFVERYFLWGVPASALLVAWLIAGIEPARARRAAGLVVVLALVGGRISQSGKTHGSEDWRGAVQAINSMVKPGTPVVFQSGFSESSSVHFEALSGAGGPLLAPLATYPIAARLFAVPGRLDTSAREQLEQIVSGSLLQSQSFVVLTRGSSSVEVWLLGRLSTLGFVARHIGDFGLVSVVIFERSTASGNTRASPQSAPSSKS